MPEFTAKDVQRLRQLTGVGIARREEGPRGRTTATSTRRPSGSASQGIASAAKRDRPRSERGRGRRGARRHGRRARRAALRDRLRRQVRRTSCRSSTRSPRASRPTAKSAADAFADEIERLRTTLKENISIGTRRAPRGAATAQVVDTYVHKQADRGVNAVAIVLEGGTEELAHDIAVHIAFAKPAVPLARRRARGRRRRRARDHRGDLPQGGQARGGAREDHRGSAHGLVQGARAARAALRPSDEKQSITQLLGDATIVAFAQVLIGS